MSTTLLDAGWQRIEAGVDKSTGATIILWQSPEGRQHTTDVANLLLRPVKPGIGRAEHFKRAKVGRPKLYENEDDKRQAAREREQGARRGRVRPGGYK